MILLEMGPNVGRTLVSTCFYMWPPAPALAHRWDWPSVFPTTLKRNKQ